MHVKSIVSAIALSAALALSGPAFAQTMFAGAELSAEDLPKVTERCEQLATASSTESLTETEESTAGGNEAASENAGSANATIENAPAVNDAAAATAMIDLDTVTLEQCTEAGLGGAM